MGVLRLVKSNPLGIHPVDHHHLFAQAEEMLLDNAHPCNFHDCGEPHIHNPADNRLNKKTVIRANPNDHFFKTKYYELYM